MESQLRRNPPDFDLTVQHSTDGNRKNLRGEERNQDAHLLTNHEMQDMQPSQESVHSYGSDSHLSYDSDGAESAGEETKGCKTKGNFDVLLPQDVACAELYEKEENCLVSQGEISGDEEIPRPDLGMPDTATVEESVIRMLEAQYLLTPRHENSETTRSPNNSSYGHDHRTVQTSRRTDTMVDPPISSLDEDTFSLMMISKVLSASWNLGMVSFAFQILLGIMIITNQLEKGGNIPFMVTSEVRIGQFFTILISLASEHDVLSSIQTFIVLGKEASNWDTVVGHDGNRCWSQWIISIMIPNTCKLGQGLLVIVMSFIVIVQSKTIIVLITEFTALSVVSRTDNILFSLAKYGFLGKHLQNETKRVNSANILTINNCDSNSQRITRIIISAIRPLVLTCLFLAMFGGWLSIALDQSDGNFFENRYPNCEGHFQLAKIHFFDEICYGGPLNTLECDFEGGDCVQFNQAYPLCRNNGIVFVEERIGNGKCDEDLSIPECDFDGGDCCPYNITLHPSFGDGQCNGGLASTKNCGYDNGDCLEFLRNFPNCPLDSLALKIGADKSILGNGICDGGIYLIEECGYENSDCQEGQVGQDLTFRSANVFSPEDFSVVTSRDGLSMAVGLPKVPSSNGIIAFYKYVSNARSWLKVGGDILGVENENGFKFGVRLAMNANGTIIAAVGAGGNYNNSHKTLVQMFEFDEENKVWIAVGEAYSQSGLHLDMNAAGDNIVVADPYNNIGGRKFWAGQIVFHSIDSSKQRKRAKSENNANFAELSGHSFQDRIGLESLTLAESRTEGTSLKRLMFTISTGDEKKIRVNQYDENYHEWNQLGYDISSPNSYASIMNASGDRIAISLPPSEDYDHPGGYVKVYDFNLSALKWEEVGEPIVSTVSKSGLSFSFGHNMAMNEDGTILAISSVPTTIFRTGGFVEVFVYFSNELDLGFYKLPPKNYSRHRDGNVIQEKDIAHESNIFGLHLSLSDNGTILSVGSFNTQTGHSFVKVFDLDKIFYTECAVPIPQKIGDKRCDAYHPYNSAQCSQDGGDCPPAPSAAPSISSKPSKAPLAIPSSSPTTSKSAMPSRQYLHVTFELRTDNFPSEISWDLTETLTRTRIQSGPSNGDMYLRTSTYTFQFILERCVSYEFNIYDSYGDGLISIQGGYFKILAEGGQLWGNSNGSGFQYFDTIDIYSCHPGISPRPSSSLMPSQESLSVTLELQTDRYPDEISWSLAERRTGIIIDSGPPKNENYAVQTKYIIHFTLERCTAYLFTINDNYGDGLCPFDGVDYFGDGLYPFDDDAAKDAAAGSLLNGYFKIIAEGEQFYGTSDGSCYNFEDTVSIMYCHPTVSPQPSTSARPSIPRPSPRPIKSKFSPRPNTSPQPSKIFTKSPWPSAKPTRKFYQRHPNPYVAAPSPSAEPEPVSPPKWSKGAAKGPSPGRCSLDEYGYYRSTFSVILILLTDDYPLDTEWKLSRKSYLKGGGTTYYPEGYGPEVGVPYEPNTLYQEEWILSKKEYIFTINDAGADGLSRGITPGYFNIFVDGVRVTGNASDGSTFGATDSVTIIHPCG